MEKRALGRGLGALIPGAAREEHPQFDIPIGDIVANPYQPRKIFNDDRFQELVRSVRLHGILQPVVVRARSEGGYELVAGERRFRAATAVGLARIPALVKEYTDEQSLEVALIENLQREDIGPLEAAIAYKRLVDEFQLTQEEIAVRLGKSRPSIANTLRLLNLPDEIRNSLAAEEISEGHARALLSVTDPDHRLVIWRQVVSGGLTVRDTEKLCKEPVASTDNVSRETSPQPKRPEAPRDPNILDIEDQLRKLFGTRVSISMNKDRGKIDIEFYNEDDLTRILALLGAM